MSERVYLNTICHRMTVLERERSQGMWGIAVARDRQAVLWQRLNAEFMFLWTILQRKGLAW